MTHSVYHLTVKKSYLSTTVYHIIYNTSTHMKTALFAQNFNAKLPTLIPKTYTVCTQHIKISLYHVGHCIAQGFITYFT